MVKRSAAIALRSREVPATAEQLDIFAEPRRSKSDLSLDERFELFHRTNPAVYRAFVMIARQKLDANGGKRVGAKAVWESLRELPWARLARGRNEAAAFDNSYVSRYARLAASQESDLREAFEFRKLVAKQPKVASCAARSRSAARRAAMAMGKRAAGFPLTSSTAAKTQRP